MISASGKRWVFPESNEHDVLAIQQQYDVSDILARILAARKFTPEQLATFLDPRLKDLLPDPSRLLGMDDAVSRVVKAIGHEKITIYGDYDVDGATSVSLLVRYFEALGVEVGYYIPNRLSEGYGVHIESIKKVKDNGCTLLIMVDCGTTSVSEIEFATTLGIDSIILDHHAANVILPSAVAVVNPHRIDQLLVPHTQDLCAAGVVFLFLIAVQRELKKMNFFETLPMPNLLEYCDFVALGTVCDVMPILGLNRAFVRRGLTLMRQNYGIRALIDVAGLKDKITARNLGFALGPRINAGGRIGSSTLGTQLLTTHDELEAKGIAIQLNALNEERQLMEQKTLDEAIKQIDAKGLADKPSILVGDKSWHPGVLGIIASRLKERYNRPCFVMSQADDICKGSARSVEGINIGELVHNAVRLDILVGGGGHAMAAGFSLERQKFEDFYEFLIAETSKFIESYQPTLQIDAEVSCPTIDLVRELEKLEPYGVGNPTPTLCVRRVIPVFAKAVAGGGTQCRLKNEAGNTISAIAFRNEEIGRVLQERKLISVVGTVREDYRGTGVQIIIEDVAAVFRP
jgi:single-stranded-DNA-specific exonuclease